MKKKIYLSVLTTVMSLFLVVAGTSRVLAKPDSEPEEGNTEAEAVEEADEEIEVDFEEAEKNEEDFENTEGIEEASEEIAADEVENIESSEIEGMKITLQNSLDQDLVSIEVKNFFMDEYSDNLLKDGMLVSAGETFSIGIPEKVREEELGMYDVRISYADGSVDDIPFVPFLENSSGVLCSEEGTVLIKIRDERLEAEEEPIGENEMMQLEAEVSQQMADALVMETE